jgi:hypothetical protein
MLMGISASDISMVLSGGTSNTNPALSFGGQPSSTAIVAGVNNLFANVSATQAQAGYTDYRCIYVFNDNSTDSFYNVSISIQSQISGGSTVSLGILARNEVQQISITGSPTGGYLVLKYEGSDTPHIVWNNSPSAFAMNLQNGLNGTGGLTQVSVSSIGGSKWNITFAGADGNRNQNLLTVTTNALTPSGTPALSTITEGGPRNDIAVSTGNVATAPTGVVFTSNTIIISTIRPEEGFPLWLKRVTPAGSSATALDSITFQIQGTVFP